MGAILGLRNRGRQTADSDAVGPANGSARTLPVDLPVLTVAIADANRGRRRRILSTLGSGGLVVVAEHDDVSGFVPHGASCIDAAVLAVNVLGSAELASIKGLRRALPDSRVIAITSSLRRRSTQAILDVGVDAVVLEERLSESLVPAVRAACAGLLSLPRESRVHGGRPVLSVREKQILGMVVLGFTNSFIARKLYVAESTVKSHLSSAFRKLGVSSRNEAAALILDREHGLGTGILAISDANSEAP